MHSSATYSYLFGALLLPPTSLLLLALAGLWIARRRLKLGLAVATFGVFALLCLSLGVVAERLIATLEMPPLQPGQLDDVQAIVVLAGGRNRAAPEWGGETVNHFSLKRLRYGAHLSRQSGLPLLVTGGDPERWRTAEAELMRDVLVRELGVTPRWVETQSDTTRENALLSADLLRRDGIRRIALVTSAFHLPRAVPQFRAVGFDVVPAGTDYLARPTLVLQHFFPTAESLRISSIALREWLAIGRDRLRTTFNF